MMLLYSTGFLPVLFSIASAFLVRSVLFWVVLISFVANFVRFMFFFVLNWE